MANYKKRRTVKNSRAHRHAGSWTCRGRLRYERHFAQIEKLELQELSPRASSGRTEDFDS